MTRIRPKKSIGQHFLKDVGITQRIAETIDAYKGYPVLEVGPGSGNLTRFLLDKGHDLSVVEIDWESIKHLEKNFPQLDGRIYAEDFLQMNLDSMYHTKFCVIGNYPYYISSQIFFKALDYRDQIICCSGMIQKEVAERLAARPGNRMFGILSALIQPWYDVEYLFTVSEEVFDPPPKVKSAVIRMTRNSRITLDCNESLFKQVIKTSFNQRRKTLRNSMKPILDKGCPYYELPIFDKRPEQLSIEQFIELTQLTSNYLSRQGQVTR